MEVMERRELEFQREKLREKDTTTKEMQARLQLERELAEEKRKLFVRNIRPSSIFSPHGRYLHEFYRCGPVFPIGKNVAKLITFCNYR